MDQIISIYLSSKIIIRVISALSSIIILFLVLRLKERKPVHKFFTCFNLSLLIYLFSQSIIDISILSPHLPKWMNHIVPYPTLIVLSIGINTASVHWLLTAAAYSGKIALTRRWRRFALYIPTFISFIVLTAYSIHEMPLETDGVPPSIHLLDMVSLILSFSFGVWAFALYLKTAIDTKEKVYNRQAITMTIGGCFLLLGGIPYLNNSPFPTLLNVSSAILLIINVTSLEVGIFLANIVFAYAFLKMDFLNILPVALREIFHNMNDAVLILDTHLHIIQSNSATRKIFPEIHPGAFLEDYLPTINAKIIGNDQDPNSKLEFEISLRDQIYWVRSIPLLIKDHPTGKILILTDITKRKRAEEQLAHDALHDRLTDLPNRTLLIDRLSQAIKRAQREKDFKYGILFIDLDRFKHINDSLGHQAGDQFLIQVAQRLTQSIRAVDTVARLGGDEFVVLLEDIEGLRAATDIALRIQESLSEPLQLKSQQVFTSASIGIALGGPRYQNPDDLLRDADIAMYQAKENGRSGYALFDQEMHTRILNMLQLETDLRMAVPKQDFELHYQPIVSLVDHQILGFEALLHWQHPTRGLLHPADFLHEAEETNLILPIGHWVIQQACQDLASWQAEFPMIPSLRMSVNLSNKQLFDPELINEARKAINESGIQPENLAFEITENVLSQENMSVLEALLRLKSLGVSLYVDNFGTGYTSLHILPIYPIDTLKIDRSIIRRISQNTDDFAVVQAIVNLANTLCKSVIAEGIESIEELENLLSLRCHAGQGFFFYKPLTCHSIQALLKREISNFESIERSSL